MGTDWKALANALLAAAKARDGPEVLRQLGVAAADDLAGGMQAVVDAGFGKLVKQIAGSEDKLGPAAARAASELMAK